ncbi:MAG: aminoglycoside phosphotransferase family protein [Akkermansia sp.]
MSPSKKTTSTFITNQILTRIAKIGDEFAIEGEFIDGEEIQSGHINTTYRATYMKADGTKDQYILQRINNQVFKDPRAVMRNVERVTRHINWKVLRIRKDSAGQTLNLYPARGGRSYTELPDHGLWRCYNFIEGTHTYDIVENTRQAYQAGFAFGSFQDLISDMNPEDLAETIPNFHHTRNRYNRLMSVAELDPKNRLATCREELEFIKKREQDVDTLLNLQQDGTLPTRITHNDTKINNVMMDEKTDQAVCVIDLDTVMPGLVLYDFGDMVRTVTSPADEDEEDLSKVQMRMHMFEAIVNGYLDSAHSFLTEPEIRYLAFSGKLITLEIGIRFLTDYLEGDIYFKTSKPAHNLIRAKTQLKLVECIEAQLPDMEVYVRNIAQSYKR